ncbi:hypothetical protein F0357_04650 [Rhizobiales bacterium Sp-1]|uniref:Uncharacterized protein n=1 Tax=Segnochrobactrum spirostomi TaxID=2608987 RepID=A0A6A7Y297_9HYPH|nr:hypothetical protein [Segnochrobactrum spirostomi]
MSWGIAVLLITLFYSRGKKSNFQKLQFLAHSVRHRESREEVRGLLSGVYRPSDVSVHVEPSLNRAVAFACALKLAALNNGTSLSLTEKGAQIAKSIIENQDSLKEESEFLREVAPKITDSIMKRVWRLEDLR